MFNWIDTYFEFALVMLSGPILIGILCILNSKIWYKEIYSENFYWSTWDKGIDICTATFYKIKYTNSYFIEFSDPHRDYYKHPKYKEFLKKCEQLKNKQNE